MIGIILTAGCGSRIEALKSCRSKCMLIVNGCSILQRKMEQVCHTEEMKKIYVVVHPDETEIQAIFGGVYRGIPIEYVLQKGVNSGIIDALYTAVKEKKLYNEDILLCLGDEYFKEFDVRALVKKYMRNKTIYAVVVSDAEVDVIKKNYSIRASNQLDILEAVEKPKQVYNHYLGTGIIMFHGKILQLYETNIYRSNYKNAKLVDLFNEVKQFGIVAKMHLIKTEYYNVNSLDEYYQLNNNKRKYPQYKSIIDMFQKCVQDYENNIAVVDLSEKITFGELNRQSDIICNIIRKKSRATNRCIGILCGRTIAHIAVVFGILKSGNFYLPLDEKLPSNRIEYMLNQSECMSVIGKSEYIKMHRLCIVSYAYEDMLAEEPDTLESQEKDIESITRNAYVIFTSGSTGKPKGVMITQKNLMNLVWGMKEEILDAHVKPHLEIGVLASFSFDLSVQQIFCSLLFGHTLHILPYQSKFMINELLQQLNELDICDGTPLIMDMLNEFMQSHPAEKLKLKHYISAGEMLKKNTIHTFFKLCPEILVTNAYGPTECTVETTFFHLNKGIEERYDEIPIGRAMGNTRVYILNEDRRFVTTGKVGEIWIAGTGVGAGYINDKILTEKSFYTDVLSPDRKMYKTGDLGYYTKEGNICYAGRMDSQIKLKGYRIEIGEIEKKMEEIPGVKLCKVILIDGDQHNGSEKKLVAYYLEEKRETVSLEDILRYLGKELPDYMIPQYFVRADKFLINNNGKLDRQALPDYKKHAVCVKKESDQGEEEHYLNFLNYIEQIIGKSLGSSASFISVGMDSLAFFSLVLHIQDEYQLTLNIADLSLWMNSREFYCKIFEKEDGRKNYKKIIFNESKYTNKKYGENALVMQKYLADIEKVEDAGTMFRYVNQMIYLVSINGKVDYQKLNIAYHRIQMENDIFRLRFNEKGRNYKVFCDDLQMKDVIQIDVAINLKKGSMCSEVDEDIMNPILYHLREPKAYDDELYQLLCCTGGKDDLLILSVHHNIFDYLSLMYFLKDLERYYDHSCSSAVCNKGSFFNYIRGYNKYLRYTSCRNEKEFWEQLLQRVDFVNISDVIKNIAAKGENDISFDYVDKKLPYCSKPGYRIVSSRISDFLYNKIKNFRAMENVMEIYIYMSVFYYFLRQYTGYNRPAILFYSPGRNNCEKLNMLGFFSHLLCFDGLESDENYNFKELTRNIEKKMQQLIQNDFGMKIKMDWSNEVLAKGIIFDYQKFYNNNSTNTRLWNKIYYFESSGIGNPMAFRIYDYGDFAEICVQYHNENLREEEIQILLKEYMKCMDIMLEHNERMKV